MASESGNVVGSATLTDTARPDGRLRHHRRFDHLHPDRPQRPRRDAAGGGRHGGGEGPGYYPTPVAITATLVGNYVWTASYSGDALNLGAVEPNTSAKLANETVTTIRCSRRSRRWRGAATWSASPR